MRYQALLNDTVFFDTSSPYDGYLLTAANIELEAGCAGSFTFSIPPQNICYGMFNKLADTVTVTRDGTEIFTGRVYGESGEFNTVHTVTCEGILAVFNDSIFEPATYECSLAELVAAIAENHNSKCPTWPITVGDLEIEDDYLYREYENYETSKSRLDDLVDSYGGYLEIRHEDDTFYLDWKDYDNTLLEGQSVDFGENLIDITQESTADEIITALIPIGATVSEEDDDGETTEYTVDISSVNDGLMYIYDEDAVASFGWIWGTYTWDDVEEPENLYTKAAAYLEKMCKSQVTVDVTAVDLALIDETIEHFRIGLLAHVTAAPQGIDEDFLVAKLSFNLLDPSSDTMELGSTHEGFVSASKKMYQSNVKLIENIVANYATNTALSAVAQKVVTNTTLINQNSESITLLAAQTTQVETDIILLAAEYTVTATSQTLTVSEATGLGDTNYAPDLDDASGDAACYITLPDLDEWEASYAITGHISSSGGYTETAKTWSCTVSLPTDATYYVSITASGDATATVSLAGISVEQDFSESEKTYTLAFADIEAGTYTLSIEYTYIDDDDSVTISEVQCYYKYEVHGSWTLEETSRYCTVELPEDGTYYVFVTASGDDNLTVELGENAALQELSEDAETYVFIFEDISAGENTLTLTADDSLTLYAVYIYQKVYSEAYSQITLLSDSITAEVTRATEAEGTLSTTLTQTAENLTALIEENDTTMLIRASGEGVEIARLEDDEYTSTITLIDETGMTVSSASGSTKYLECLSTGINLYASGVLGLSLTSGAINLYAGGAVGQTITASGTTLYADGNTALALNSSGLYIYYSGSLGTSIISNTSYGTLMQSTSGIGLVAASGQLWMESTTSSAVLVAGGSGSEVHIMSESGSIMLDAPSGHVYATPYAGGNSLYAVPTCSAKAASHIDAGVTTITASAGTTSSMSVSFNGNFSATPAVIITGATAYPQNRAFSVSDRSASGFTLHVYNAGSNDASISVSWMAIGYV